MRLECPAYAVERFSFDGWNYGVAAEVTGSSSRELE